MALNKAALQAGILQLMTDMRKKTEVADAEYAERLSTLIDDYVKTGMVTVALGIPVSTTGSATAQTGATTATGTGTIS